MSENNTQGFFCHTCGKYHDYIPMDIAFDHPFGWTQEDGTEVLNGDLCTIESDYFIRGCLEIPVSDADGPFVWGVWTTLSEKNFKRVQEIWSDDNAVKDEPPYFGWFASRLPSYPETLLLKTYVHLRPDGLRPWIELEPTEHPLAVEQREGITMARVHELLALAGYQPGK